MRTAPDSEELYIAVDGKKLGGWMECHVIRGVERLPSAFYIAMTDKAPGQLADITPKPGSACKIYLSGDLILTGYIDVFSVRLSAGQHEVRLSGRSKCEDIVDSAINGNEIGGWQLQAKTIGEAAKKIAKPFNIEVSLPDGDTELPPPQVFPINPGVTGAQLLEEIARTTGNLVWDDPEGRLVISGVGTTRTNTALVEGQNIETASSTRRMDIRFSDYYVLGQGFTQVGTPFINSSAHAEDPELKALGRHRTRIIPWEAPDQAGEYSRRRALWEASRRYGRGNMITIQVTGWRDGAGKVWTPNTVVSIDAPNCKVKSDMVISEVAWNRGPDTGTTSTLTCMPKAGLIPQPLIIAPAVIGVGEQAPRG